MKEQVCMVARIKWKGRSTSLVCECLYFKNCRSFYPFELLIDSPDCISPNPRTHYLYWQCGFGNSGQIFNKLFCAQLLIEGNDHICKGDKTERTWKKIPLANLLQKWCKTVMWHQLFLVSSAVLQLQLLTYINGSLTKDKLVKK